MTDDTVALKTDNDGSVGNSPIDDSLIEDITRRIVEALDPHRVILFGSRARGDARSESDIDLFIEMDSNEKPYYRHGRARGALRGVKAPLDVIVMTPDEVASRRAAFGSLVPVIEREGKVLFHR